MKIFIEEEYGYAHYIWDYPHDAARLLKDWEDGRAPLSFWGCANPEGPVFDGTLTRFSFGSPDDEERVEGTLYFVDMPPGWTVKQCDATCHVHCEDDTWLLLVADGKRCYRPSVIDRPTGV